MGVNDAKEKIELRVYTKHTYHETERWLRSVNRGWGRSGFQRYNDQKGNDFLKR